MNRRFAIGDIHGNHRALMQCLEFVDFDYDNDELISLGDVCDGYPETPLCVDTLMKVKNLIWIEGNHDQWCKQWFEFGLHGFNSDGWILNGGQSTLDAYSTHSDKAFEQRSFWLTKPIPYYRIGDVGFVHAGVNPLLKFNEHVGYSKNILFWDRNLVSKGNYRPDDTIEYAEGIKLLFVGHTAIVGKPMITKSLINLDTGGGWAGTLTIMNIDTKEYYQSSPGPELYPGYKHRGKGK